MIDRVVVALISAGAAAIGGFVFGGVKGMKNKELKKQNVDKESENQELRNQNANKEAENQELRRQNAVKEYPPTNPPTRHRIKNMVK